METTDITNETNLEKLKAMCFDKIELASAIQQDIQVIKIRIDQLTREQSSIE